MGSVKHAKQQHDDSVQYALSIAIQAGAVKECEFDPGTYLAGPQDLEAAYRLANAQWSGGQHQKVFKSRREMTDAIQEGIEHFVCEECYGCRKRRDE